MFIRLALLSMVLTAGVPVWAQDVADLSDETAKSSPFRIWENLRNAQSGELLHGLVQRMDAAVAEQPHDGAMWATDVGTCELTLGVQTDADAGSEIHIGLFQDARWWLAPPAHVRTIRGGGVHKLQGLKPGRYYIGALAGSLPYPHAVGVHLGWPNAVEVRSDSRERARILVSRDFKWDLAPQITFNKIESRSALKEKEFVTGKNKRLVCIHVIDGSGEPVRYCQVNMTEHHHGDPGPHLDPEEHRDGTNSDGCVYFELTDEDVEVSVQVTRFDFTTSPLVCRSHRKADGRRYRPMPGKKLTIVCDEMSHSGGSLIQGVVQDQYGEPVELMEVLIQSVGLAHDPQEGRQDFRQRKLMVIRDGGRFEVPDVPPGTHRLLVLPLDSEAYVQHRREVTIPESAPPSVDTVVEMERRDLFYGTVVNSDGSPGYPLRGSAALSGPDVELIAWRGIWLSTRRDGSFRIAVSKAEAKLLHKHSGNQFRIYDVDNPELRTKLDYRTLSRDQNHPTPVDFP